MNYVGDMNLVNNLKANVGNFKALKVDDQNLDILIIKTVAKALSLSAEELADLYTSPQPEDREYVEAIMLLRKFIK